MGLFNAIRSFVARFTTSGKPAGGRRGFGYRTESGVHVDADSALKTAAVWACVQYLSKTVAQLPWHVYRGGQDESGGEIARSNPADYLLHKRPNPEMGSFIFRLILTWWAVMWGNGYAEIEWDNRGAPYAFWPLHPNRVKPLRDDAGVLFYRVWNATGGYVDMPAADILHIRGYGDDAVGYSVMEYAARSIGWAQATEIFGAAFFGQGMNPSTVVEVQKSLSPEALDLLKKDMARVYNGANGDRTAFLDAGMKLQKLATAPNDAQFIETREHQVEEICRWFGVPPHKVMMLLRATFSNIEHQSIEVVVDSITPWVKVWEEETDYKLFGARNPQNLYTKMNLKGLMRGDSTARSDFFSKAFMAGGMTINDFLRSEDMPTIGPAGDVRFVPMAMQTLEAAIAAGKFTVENPAAKRPEPPAAPAKGA